MHRPPDGALVAGVAHGAQPVVDDVGAHLAFGVLHQFLDLLHEDVDEASSACPVERVTACVAQADIALHSLGIGSGELCRRPCTTGQIDRFKYFHDLLVLLGQGASSDVDLDVDYDLLGPPMERSGVQEREFAVRPPGDLASASREFSVRLPGE